MRQDVVAPQPGSKLQQEFRADQAPITQFSRHLVGDGPKSDFGPQLKGAPRKGAGWSADKWVAYESLGIWRWNTADPLPQPLYSYLTSQRRDPDVARVRGAVDPSTRRLRPLSAEERRWLFAGG